MSIIEEAVRKASEQSMRSTVETSSFAPAATARVRSRLRAAVDPAQARQYHPISLEAKTLERNRILPRISDQAALRAFKILRTRVLRRMEAHKWRSLAVTGIVPGEGKTLNATNLAIALAQDVNTWVYLVDLDLQRPQVANSLGLRFQRGLGEYLLGDATIEDIIYDVGLPRLAVIPNARALPQSSEHLTSPRMMDLLQALDKEVPQRIIVFDMPPLLASDDVLAFAPQVDGVLLVVSEGMTQRGALQSAREVLSEMNLVGVVLNRSRERNDSGYYT